MVKDISSNLIFGSINQRVGGSSPPGGAIEVIGTDLKIKLPLMRRATL